MTNALVERKNLKVSPERIHENCLTLDVYKELISVFTLSESFNGRGNLCGRKEDV